MNKQDDLSKKLFWQNEFETIRQCDMSRLDETYKKIYEISDGDFNYKNKKFNLDSLFSKNNKSYNEIKNYEVLLITAVTIYFFILNHYKNTYILINNNFFKKPHEIQGEINSYIPFFTDINPGSTFIKTYKDIEKKIRLFKLNYIDLLSKKNDLFVTRNDFEIKMRFLPLHKEVETNENQEEIIFSSDGLKFICKIKSTIDLPLSISRYIKEHIKNILVIASNNSKVKIYDILLLTRHERQKTILQWNDTKLNYDFSETDIFNIVKKNAELNPHKIAISYEEQNINYKLLMQKVENLSLKLAQSGLKKQDRVLIFLDRSPEMVIAILATLQNKACYVPIDIKFPETRVLYILKNSESSFVLTNNNQFSKINTYNYNEPFEKINFNNNLLIIKFNNKLVKPISEIPAYLIYTSGSTGEPKGVLVSHKNVINYSKWFINSFNFSQESSIDFSSSISFDLSVSCTLMPLIAGGKIAIYHEEDKLDLNAYLQHLVRHSITHVEWTPDYFHHILNHPEEFKTLLSLKWIMLGGDAIVKKDVKNCFNLLPLIKVVNEYGPTECTVAITSHVINTSNIDLYHETIPIGKPALNTQAYVLDAFLNPCSIGIPGELHISGESVCLGYLEQDKTEKKFIQNPFNKKYDVMYKTGDIVRWLPDGNLDFLGREDDQVKIRGYRVEISEIEKNLLQHEWVEQCKILLNILPHGEKILVCYVVLQTNIDFSIKEIRAYLQEKLPDYMIPNRFILMDRFPTNVNGKVDLKSLKNINNQSQISIDDTVKESSLLIDNIRSIWQKSFHLNSIDHNENFFDLGGSSLTALNIINQINIHFNIKLNTNSIFLYPSIDQLAEHIESSKFNIASCVENSGAPLSFCLSPQKNQPAIIFIHPVGGSIFIFNLLAKTIGNKYTVYALQDPGIEDPSIRFDSLEEMASLYIKTIRSIQKRGPYNIAGASFGATLAVEIAHQLLLEKEIINFIGLFDGWASYPSEFTDRKFFNDFMYERVQSLEPTYGQELLEMQYSREMLLWEYNIVPINSKLTLFKATDIWPVFKNLNTRDNGWGKFIHQPLEVHMVPGNHESMFFDPNVDYLSELLQKCLAQIPDK